MGIRWGSVWRNGRNGIDVQASDYLGPGICRIRARWYGVAEHIFLHNRRFPLASVFVRPRLFCLMTGLTAVTNNAALM